MRAAEQRLEFERLDDILEPLDLGRHFGGEGFVLNRHLDHGGQIVARLESVVERRHD
jgi:hypothetical protein